MKLVILLLLVLLISTPAWAKPDKKFWLFTAAVYGSVVADEEVTQYKLRQNPLLRESNPLLGSSRKRAYPILLGLATSSTLSGYILKRRESKSWWVPQTVAIGIHGFAVGWNLHFHARQEGI